MRFPYVSLDKRKKWLEEIEPGNHIFAAEVDGRVVGNLGLHCQRDRHLHVGFLGMGIHDEFAGRGIGTAMMASAMDMADNWLDLKRLELEVYTDNVPAIRLYEKFGFKKEGTH